MATPDAEVGYVIQAGGMLGYLATLLDQHESTPELRWPQSIDVYDRMRREEAQVSSVVTATTEPVLRAKWSIDPAGCRPEVVDLVSQDLGLPILGQRYEAPLRERDRFSWSTHLRLALLSRCFGHAYFEQVYRYEAGLFRLRKLAYRPPRTISKIDVAHDGGLVAIEQFGTSTLGGKAVRLPVDRLVAYVNEREGANWLGKSILRPAYKFWLLKDELLRLGMLVADRNGMGVPVYTSAAVPESLTDPSAVESFQDSEIEKGLDIATSARSGPLAGASLPNGATLRFIGVEGKTVDLLPWVRYFDEQMARASLAHFLNLGGDGATGSYNLAGVFESTFTNSLQSTAQDVCDVTNQHVIEDLVDINFGVTERAPRLVFEEIGASHPATAEAIKLLVDAGVLTADGGLEAHVRRTRGLPALDDPTAPRPPRKEPAANDSPS